MSSGGKSGSSQKSLNYYGTFGVAISWRLDWLTAVIANGNYVWQCSGGGPLDFTAPDTLAADGSVDLTGGILDPTLFMEGGGLFIYPGIANSAPCPALPGHPIYPDEAYAVASRIFFGQNSGTAPNLQFIGGCRPRVPTSIVAAEDNIVDDRQINPVAYIAEFLLDERGKGLPEALFETTSWLASGHWCAQDAAHRAFSFCSPLFTDQVALRDVVKALLDPINGFLRWTKDGKLGCYIYEWGTDPGGLVTLDARYFTNGKRPKFKHGDWKDIPTEFVVNFTDRAYEFQDNTVRVPNARASKIRKVDDPAQLDRKHVTRSAQAFSQGMEYKRRMGSAPGTATVIVRGPVIADLQPGDKVKVDTDPEPGGDGLAQLARVDKIQIDRTDSVTLELTLDPLLPATVYRPTWISPLPETLFAGAVESSPSLVHFLSLPLPYDFGGWPPTVGFLATRPNATIIGFHAYFTSNPATAFAELGEQFGFAARCQLVNAVGSGTGTLRLQLLDGAAGPDAYIAADTPGGNVAQAQDDSLLAILVTLDGSGRVARDGAGQAVMEFCSILQRSAVTADTHDYTVYRGRAGTAAAAWGGGAVAWIIPSGNLEAWSHALFESMVGATAYFRLASFTSAAVDESVTLPETDLIWPALPTPNSLIASNGTGKAVSLNWLFSSTKSVGEYGVFRATGPGFGDWAKVGEVNATRFADHEVVLGVTYQYKIAAIWPDETTSAYSNTVAITVAAVSGAEIDPTQPNDPGAATKVGEGTYTDKAGGVHAYLMIRVPALPAAGGGKVKATSQELQWRVHGSGATDFSIQGQPQNAGGTVDIRLDDLPTGSQIDVQLVSYSQFDIPSANAIAATGSPFTTPTKSDGPAAPTGVTYVGGADSNYGRPASFGGGVLMASVRINWVPPADLDIAYYEWTATALDTNAAADAGTHTRVDGTEFIFATLLFASYYFRVRGVNSSLIPGAWGGGGVNFGLMLGVPAGNMSEQNKNNVKISALKVGDTSASSVKQVLAIYDDSVVVSVGNGVDPFDFFTVSLSNCGFSTKPTSGAVECEDPPLALDACYDVSNGANSSVQAIIKVQSPDGTTPITTNYRRFSVKLTQTF